MIKRKRPRRHGDKFGLMREAGVGNLPPLYVPRKGKKFQDPEDILQGETNELLARAGQFNFRLSAHVLSKAHDASIGGWPDNPLISKLIPGLSLLGPLELKRPGEDLRPNQLEMQNNIGTVRAESFPTVEKYLQWSRDAAEVIRRHLMDHPLPPAPCDVVGATRPAKPEQSQVAPK
jgi:hypothetical protein